MFIIRQQSGNNASGCYFHNHFFFFFPLVSIDRVLGNNHCTEETDLHPMTAKEKKHLHTHTVKNDKNPIIDLQPMFSIGGGGWWWW